jgi:hypothetical protein
MGETDLTLTDEHFAILGEVEWEGNGNFQSSRECVELLHFGYLEPVQYGDGPGIGITEKGSAALKEHEDKEDE